MEPAQTPAPLGLRCTLEAKKPVDRLLSVVTRKLVRPRDGRWIAGVCAGIADRFGVSRNLVRALFVVSVILPGPQFVIYLALWILIPSAD
jgi:phage shock protein PspC (stress-responsive transcriptional regulator)